MNESTRQVSILFKSANGPTQHGKFHFEDAEYERLVEAFLEYKRTGKQEWHRFTCAWNMITRLDKMELILDFSEIVYLSATTVAE